MNIIFPGRMTFLEGLALQESYSAEVARGGEEALILLEHAPVYTIGRTRDRSSLSGAEPYPVHETNRGGQATYHGPGQLTGYPILDLNKRGRDLHAYLRFLEGVLIEFCAGYGVTASRKEGLTGVWVGPRKIASLGVGVRKWITMHGFAINVQRGSIEPFSHITPCGISGVQITSLEDETGGEIDFSDAVCKAAACFQRELPELFVDIRPDV